MHARSNAHYDKNALHVRRLLTGEQMYTLPNSSVVRCMLVVPGQSALLVTGHLDGQVHVWNIGWPVYKYQSHNAGNIDGVHVAQVACAYPRTVERPDGVVIRMCATPTRLAFVRTTWPLGQYYSCRQLMIVNYEAIICSDEFTTPVQVPPSMIIKAMISMYRFIRFFICL